MQNALNCQITSTRKIKMKLFKTFTIFLKIFSKKVSLDVDFGKLRKIILDMAKIHQPLVKKETCDF